MGRPPKDRTAVPVSFKLDPAIHDWWAEQAGDPKGVAKMLQRLATEKAEKALNPPEPKTVLGKMRARQEAAGQFAEPSKCPHPVGRRIGNECAMCGSKVGKK